MTDKACVMAGRAEADTEAERCSQVSQKRYAHLRTTIYITALIEGQRTRS